MRSSEPGENPLRRTPKEQLHGVGQEQPPGRGRRSPVELERRSPMEVKRSSSMGPGWTSPTGLKKSSQNWT